MIDDPVKEAQDPYQQGNEVRQKTNNFHYPKMS